MSKYLLLALLITAGSLFGVTKLYLAQVEESRRLEGNQETLNTDIRQLEFRDSLHVATVTSLQYRKSELIKYQNELVQTVEDLGVKVKRLESASTTKTETKYIINTVTKDSLIYVDGIVDTLRCIDYATKWLNLSGCIDKEGFNGDIITRDSLVHLVTTVPKKFLFIKYGVKAIELNVISFNPNSEIKYVNYIELD